MSEHPPPGIRERALRLPVQDRLALAAELLDSVEGAADADWDAAWHAALNRRAQDAETDPAKLEDWAVVRDRILRDLRAK